ncbi:MAG: ABC transporter ATP-binding protein, partial [Deltaproteobacteria bacterium]|nr:ABC transporter ATP-binding protein [Deltaproteobacteria bacterium]
MISIDHLTRRYGEVLAVDDVSLEVERGEVVGLLGHNGAGKTTVMKILTGFLEPTSGRVTVGGHDTTQDRTAAQRQIGYLPENAPLYPEMLVQEYLCMMAELREVAQGEVPRAVAEAALATGLENHLVTPIHTLSKGYRQRVGIAQAIVHRPPVLVLDEPTNGLDPTQIQSIRDLILKLAERTTIILSTHILQEIEAVCGRVLVMIDGALAADEALDDLLSSQTVTLSLRGGHPDTVAAQLRAIGGVRSVTNQGEDPDHAGFRAWELDCEPAANPVPDVVEAAQAENWSIAAAAPRRLTLERVFRELLE